MDTESRAYGAHPSGRRHLDSFNDTARKFCSIYLSEADQHDSTMTETWRANMDSTLIFAGLFSATVTAFIIEGYKLLKQDPQDVTESLLKQILTVQLALASSNQTSPSVLPPIIIPTFSPNPSAIIVNSLWFLSLIASLAAALCVTLAQQWIRAYLHGAHCNTRPVERARMRAFLFAGLENWKFDTIVEFIPFLLHISLFLFFVGLCVFMWAINRTVATIAIVMVFCFFAVYGLATVAPIYDLSSPFGTPLSSPIWYFWQWLLTDHFRGGIWNSPFFKLTIIADAREKQAEHNSSIWDDAKVLLWVYERTSDNDELEPFLTYIVGLLEASAGTATWQRAFVFGDDHIQSPTPHRTLILDIEERISHLLPFALVSEEKTRANYRERSGAETGALMYEPSRLLTTCLDALVAILNSSVAHFPPYAEECLSFIRESLDGHIKTLGVFDTNLSLSIHLTRSLSTYRFPARRENPPSYTEVLSGREMATATGRALWDLDHMRQGLEDAISAQLSCSSGEHRHIRVALESYLSVLTTVSPQLRKDMTSLVDLGYRLGLPSYIDDLFVANIPYITRSPRPHPRDSDKLELPEAPLSNNRCSRTCVEYDIYALHTVSLMRMNGLYPQLPDFSEPIHHTPPRDLLDMWFPQCRNSLETSDYLLRELQPIAVAIDILVPGYIRDHRSKAGKDIIPAITRGIEIRLKISPILRHPFSLFVSALNDADIWEHGGAPTTAFLSLISYLEHGDMLHNSQFLFSDSNFSDAVTIIKIRNSISRTLATLYPPSPGSELQPMNGATAASLPLKGGTTLFYMVSLERLLAFERDFIASSDPENPRLGPFLFQEQDICRLVELLSDTLAKGSLKDVEDAERTFNIEYEPHAHVLAEIEDQDAHMGLEIHSELPHTAPPPLASFNPPSDIDTRYHTGLPINNNYPQQIIQRLSIIARSENVKEGILAQRAAFLESRIC